MADEEQEESQAGESEQAEKAQAAGRGAARSVVAASGARAVPAPSGHAIVVAQPLPLGPALPKVSRRGVLRTGFWVAMGAMLLGIVATTLDSIYPRRTRIQGGQVLSGTSEVSPFGSAINVGKVDLIQPGKPVHNLDARAWIMRFDEERAKIENDAGNTSVKPGMILALYQKCVHLGCTVPWREDFTFADPRLDKTYSGWFRCPCHGSTYTYGGVRVFGPAPRSLDTFAVSVQNGNLIVDTGKITLGDTHDPERAVMP